MRTELKIITLTLYALNYIPITGVLFIHIRLNFVNNIYLNIIRFDYWISLYDFIIIILTKKIIKINEIEGVCCNIMFLNVSL